VAEAGLGLAPGSAFGPEGEGFVRWCFAASPERLEAGVARLRAFLGAHSLSAQQPENVAPSGVTSSAEKG
jgi:hypothetical protein